MRTKAMILLGPLFVAAIWSTGTLACTYPDSQPTNQAIKRMAERAFNDATTVIDGEVISPMLTPNPEGTLPVARVKVLHTWKGRVRLGEAAIAAYTSCDLPLVLKGQRVRLFLSGIGIFTADAFNNGAGTGRGDQFNRYVDRLIGARRPADFTSPWPEQACMSATGKKRPLLDSCRRFWTQ